MTAIKSTTLKSFRHTCVREGPPAILDNGNQSHVQDVDFFPSVPHQDDAKKHARKPLGSWADLLQVAQLVCYAQDISQRLVELPEEVCRRLRQALQEGVQGRDVEARLKRQRRADEAGPAGGAGDEGSSPREQNKPITK